MHYRALGLRLVGEAEFVGEDRGYEVSDGVGVGRHLSKSLQH
jgi:hypothetical protein